MTKVSKILFGLFLVSSLISGFMVYNVEDVADQIFEAYQMTRREQQRRMSQLRREVQRHNVFRWVDSFLETIGRPDLRPGGVG